MERLRLAEEINLSNPQLVKSWLYGERQNRASSSSMLQRFSSHHTRS
jgi:hypothetical protein